VSNGKLLIIDDLADVHELVKVWLASEPIEFFSSYDGDQALDLAPMLRPDLILLDVDLPGMNGFEVCRRLKLHPATADVPIIFLTGAAATEDKLRGLELGASDYLIKPFDPAELRARVRTSIQSKRLMDLLAQKAQSLQESEARFRVLAENSSDVIFRHTPDGVCLYVSPACAAILGYTPRQLQSKSLFDYIHAEDINAVRACYSTPRAPGVTGAVEFRFQRSEGQYVWLESTCRTLLDPRSGDVIEIHASSRDIGARKQMELREQVRADVLEMITAGRPLNEILHRLIEAVETQEPNAVAASVMLRAGVVYHCAPHLPAPLAASIERQMYQLLNRFSELADASDERILWCDLLNDPAWQELAPKVAEQDLKSCWAALIRSGHREPRGAFVLYRRDEARPNESAAAMLQLASDLSSVALEHRDLTDQLTFQAHHDALTRLPNRILFADRLEQALTHSARTGQATAILLVDVDRFKYINDTFGHQAGDELLCQIAHRLRTRLRASDALARMGGDEFAAILTEISNPADAQAVADVLVREFQAPIALRGRDVFISISVGAAVYPGDGRDASNLLMNADLALYRAKDAGRNTAKTFAPEMSEGVIARLEMEHDLRRAIENDGFFLHFQPKVNCAGLLMGVEALLRWQHPALGLIPPAKFIPIAEDTGLILPIGAWVLQEAARQQRVWVNAGLPLTGIAVNVSAIQFGQPDFIQTIRGALDAAGNPEPWLEIELTESLLMENMRSAADKLSLLKSMNVQVSIDDFGTGYSSLAYLQRLTLDTLKIDNSFIHNIDTNDGNGQAIISAIVTLARSLNLKTVAEGVERPAQREFLQRIGCDMLQGNLICPAVTAEQVEPWLRRRSALPNAA